MVDKIKDLALAHPAYGYNRYEAMLALEGIRVSLITIQKILHDHGLGTKIDRWLALEARNAEKAIEIAPEQAVFLKKLSPCFRERHVEASSPGELLSADTFFVGSLKGVGKVYLHAVVDTFGSYVFGFFHVSKQPEAAVAVLRNEVLPFYRNLDLPVRAVLTDNGREFCGTERHTYELYLDLNGIEHHRTKVRTPKTNGFVERFNGTVLNEFFRMKMSRDVLRDVRRAASRSRRLADPLQHRTPASGTSQHGPKTHRNRHVIRKQKVMWTADRLEFMKACLAYGCVGKDPKAVADRSCLVALK